MEQLNSSACNVSNNTSPLEGWGSENLVAAVVLSISFLVGVPGNVAVIVFLRQNSQLSSLSRGLMLNLAVSDLLCLLILPAWVYNILHSWDMGVAVCKVTGFLFYWSVYCSLLNVTMLSVQRYLQVALPQRISRLGLAGQRVLLAGIWGCAACITSLYPVVHNLELLQLEGRRKEHRVFCTIVTSSDSQRLSVLLTEVILGFVVPVSAMTSAYICLHRRATQSVFFNKPRMTRLISSIIVTFIVLWTPFQLVNILGVAGMLMENKSLYKFYCKSWIPVGSLTVLNSVLDPFLYAFASRRTQRETSNTPP